MKSVDAMLAVDTNIVVRYLVKDDDAQSARAREVVGSGAIFVPLTVVLECEWVLRSLYGFSRPETIGALEAFCGTPDVSVGDADAPGADVEDAPAEGGDALEGGADDATTTDAPTDGVAGG